MSLIAERIKQTSFENDGQEVVISLLVAASYVREKLNIICGKKSISLHQFNILRILKGVHPEGYPRSEISDRMIDRAPDTTRLIDRLIKENLVTRQQCNEDKRRSISTITNKGIEVIDKVYKDMQTYNKTLQETLSKTKCNQITEICNNILEI